MRKPRSWQRAGQPNYDGKANPMRASIIDRQMAQARELIRRAEERADSSEARLREMERVSAQRIAEAEAKTQAAQQQAPAGAQEAGTNPQEASD